MNLSAPNNAQCFSLVTFTTPLFPESTNFHTPRYIHPYTTAIRKLAYDNFCIGNILGSSIYVLYAYFLTTSSLCLVNSCIVLIIPVISQLIEFVYCTFAQANQIMSLSCAHLCTCRSRHYKRGFEGIPYSYIFFIMAASSSGSGSKSAPRCK